MKAIRYTVIVILVMGSACSSKPGSDKKEEKGETWIVDGDSVSSEASQKKVGKDVQLHALTPELQKDILEKLREAEGLIVKYAGNAPASAYDAGTLDKVLAEWRASKDVDKEQPSYMMQALGAAFGQDIVNSYDFEWMVLTDEYGPALTVIHKKYFVSGFPLSSAEKAVSDEHEQSFQSIKLSLKKQAEDAEKTGNVEER